MVNLETAMMRRARQTTGAQKECPWVEHRPSECAFSGFFRRFQNAFFSDVFCVFRLFSTFSGFFLHFPAFFCIFRFFSAFFPPSENALFDTPNRDVFLASAGLGSWGPQCMERKAGERSRRDHTQVAERHTKRRAAMPRRLLRKGTKGDPTRKSTPKRPKMHQNRALVLPL